MTETDADDVFLPDLFDGISNRAGGPLALVRARLDHSELETATGSERTAVLTSIATELRPREPLRLGSARCNYRPTPH